MRAPEPSAIAPASTRMERATIAHALRPRVYRHDLPELCFEEIRH